MKTRFLVIIGVITIFAMTFFVVGFDQGHILSTIYGEQAFTDLYIHELTHDMRHAAGFDCHDKSHNETVWQEAYGEYPESYPMPQVPFCDETYNDDKIHTGDTCALREVWEPQYIGGGSIDLDPDLSPSYALDFSFGHYFYPLGIIFGIFASLFVIPYLILKRKNIPSRPYLVIILAVLLLFIGHNSILMTETAVNVLSNLETTDPQFVDALMFSWIFMGIVPTGIGIILLYKSSLIRKWLKR